MGDHPLRERAQLCYLMMFFAAWDQKEPGVLPYSPRRLAQLSGVSLEEWVEIEAVVRPGFKVRESDGAWTFPMMMRMAIDQDETHKRLTTWGRNGGKTRARNALDGQASLKPGLSHPQASSSSSSSSASTATEEDKDNPKHLAAEGVRESAELPLDTAPTPEVLTVEQWFEEFFWPDYPKKVKKPDALKAMRAAFRRTKPGTPAEDELADKILAGLAKYRSAIDGQDAQFVSHPGPWIRNKRWEDEL